MTHTGQAANAGRIITAIIAAGLVLRLWGVWFGLPYLYHYDEPAEVQRALKLGLGDFDFQRAGKAGYYYLLFVEYGLYFLVLKLSGWVQSTADFARLYFQNPSGFYLIGRVTTAIIGTFNIFMVYLLGKRCFSARAGLLGALFLAFNEFHVNNSHFVTVDIPMTCMVTVGLWFALQICQRSRLRDYVLAGVFGSLAIQCKITAVFILLPFLAAHIYSIRRSGAGIREFLLGRNVCLGVLALGLITIIGNPGLLFNFKGLIELFAASFMGKAAAASPEISLFNKNLFLYYSEALLRSMGLPLFVVSLLAAAYAAYKRTPADILLLAFTVPFFTVMACSTNKEQVYFRYMIPVLPFLALMAGRLLSEWKDRRTGRAAEALVWSAALALIAIPGVGAALHDNEISHKDTRTVAKEWVDANIPAGATILLEGRGYLPVEVPLVDLRANLEEKLRVMRRNRPGTGTYLAMYLKYRKERADERAYNLIFWKRSRDGVMDLEDYKAMGVEYIILTRKWERHPKIQELYEVVLNDADIEQLVVFTARRFRRPGPPVLIFRLRPDQE